MVNSHVPDLDELILQIFEEQEDSFYFPIHGQKQARAFVKALHGKGLPYDILQAEIGEFEHNFSSWRKGLGRSGIGTRVIERINQPLQEVLDEDEDELYNHTNMRHKHKNGTDVIEDRLRVAEQRLHALDEKNRENERQRENEVMRGKLDALRQARNTVPVSPARPREEPEDPADILKKKLESMKRERDSRRERDSQRESDSHSGDSSDEAPHNGTSSQQNGTPGTSSPDVTHSPRLIRHDPTTSPRRTPAPREPPQSSSQNNEFMNMFKQIKGSTSSGGESDGNKSDKEEKSQKVISEKIDKPIEKPIEVKKESKPEPEPELEREDSATESAREGSVELEPSQTREEISKPKEEPKSPQVTSSSWKVHEAPSENKSEPQPDTQVRKEEESTPISFKTTNGTEVSSSSGVEEEKSAREEAMRAREAAQDKVRRASLTAALQSSGMVGVDDVDENYNSDLDPDNADQSPVMAKLVQKISVMRSGSKNGAGYVYLFSDSDSSGSDANTRVRVGTSRCVAKRLRQAQVFNPDMWQVTSVPVSQRISALNELSQRLLQYSMGEALKNWFQGPLDAMVEIVYAVAADFPSKSMKEDTSSESQC